jgi:uncharacterized membrane protein
MDNKYIRGLVLVIAGMVALIVLLYLGNIIASSRSSEAWGIGAGQAPAFAPGNLLGGWVPWVIIGGVLLYIIYVFFAEAEMFRIGTREVVMMALGAALYGVLAWVFNIIPVPSVSFVALRPVVVIPIFFGFVFGPAVGFFVGAFGNILGDALTGWGVFPIWDIGNGLMGLIPGLAGMYLRRGGRGNTQILLWVSVGVLAVVTAMLFLFPDVTSNFTGESLGIFQIVMPAILILLLALSFAPQYWPYLMAVATIGLIVWAIMEITGTGFNWFAVALLITALITAVLAFFLYSRKASLTAWLEDDETRRLVIWGTLGVIIGIGFAAVADIFYNGYSPETAIVGEFIPAAGPNILFAMILTPLVYAAWRQARAQTGR